MSSLSRNHIHFATLRPVPFSSTFSKSRISEFKNLRCNWLPTCKNPVRMLLYKGVFLQPELKHLPTFQKSQKCLNYIEILTTSKNYSNFISLKNVGPAGINTMHVLGCKNPKSQELTCKPNRAIHRTSSSLYTTLRMVHTGH